MVSRVVLAGVSMRAAAASAARAGFDAVAVDAFDDIDRPAGIERVPISSTGSDGTAPFTVVGALRAARPLRCDAVVYGSGFEHCCRGVSALSRARELWGNPPDVLRRVRNPRELFASLASAGCLVPRIVLPSEPVPRASTDAAWLVKPLQSGGGHGIERWTPGAAVPEGHYLEEYLDGVPGSIAFVAARGALQPLGVFRQFAGDAAFGSAGYRYCGSVLSSPADLFEQGAAVAAAALHAAQVVAKTFDLVGVNGLDFMARDGRLWPIEVNPRWTASMELVERRDGVSVFGMHAAACVDGQLPTGAGSGGAVGTAIGKAIVFARAATLVGDTTSWLDCADIADVPAPGSALMAGSPVCTVFASGATAAACRSALVSQADGIYSEMSTWPSHAAGSRQEPLP